METVATLERVREARTQLVEAGQRPSADRILAVLQGGSKTTVLAHLKTIADEETQKTGFSDVPLEILTSSAAALSRRLWDEANRMAGAAYENRIRGMVEAQNGLYEDLRAASAQEEALESELKNARDRIVALEAELEGRARADQHLHQIAEMLRARETPQYRPIVQLLRLIEQEARPVEDVLRRMVELGHSRAQARTAWKHAIEYEYATERDPGNGPTLSITTKGVAKLSPRRTG